MIDRVKFYINCVLSELILSSKCKTSFKRDGKEYFIIDYDEISFMNKGSDEESVYNFIIKNSEDDEGSESKSYNNMFISYSRKIGEVCGRLTIQQNLRKNYINYADLHPMKDLNFNQFLEIINLYADEFEIEREMFWTGCKITQIEIGVNLHFKMHISSIITSVSTLKRVQKRITVDSSAIYLKAKKYEIVLYDKLDRAVDKKEIFKNLTKIQRKKLAKKINRRNSFVRFELKVNCVSQFNHSGFKGKINSMQSFKDNFVNIADSLFLLAKDITFVDVISPEINRKLINSQLNEKGTIEFNKYLQYVGLKSFGISKFIDFATPLLNTNIKLAYLRSCEDLFNKYRKNNGYVRLTFLSELQRKLVKLQKNFDSF